MIVRTFGHAEIGVISTKLSGKDGTGNDTGRSSGGDVPIEPGSDVVGGVVEEIADRDASTCDVISIAVGEIRGITVSAGWLAHPRDIFPKV